MSKLKLSFIAVFTLVLSSCSGLCHNCPGCIKPTEQPFLSPYDQGYPRYHINNDGKDNPYADGHLYYPHETSYY